MSKRKRVQHPRKRDAKQSKKVVVEYDMIDLITNWSTFIRLPRKITPRA